MAPKITFDLTEDSPPSTPTRRHHPIHPSSSKAAVSAYIAAAMRNHPPRGRPGRRPRSNFDYRRFIRTDKMKQQCLTGRPTPMTAGPSRLHHGNDVPMYSAGTRIMQQGGQSLLVPHAWTTQKGHDERFVEGVSKCDIGNSTAMADWSVKNNSPEQMRKYPADFFMVTQPLPADHYIRKKSSAGHSDKNRMVNVAPRARNPTSSSRRHHDPRANNMVHGSSGGPRLVRAPELASGQLVPASALGHFLSRPIYSAPSAIPVHYVPNDVSSSWRKPPPHMFSRFPADGPVLLPYSEVESSCSSSGSVDHGEADAEDESGINLELTLS